MLFVLRQMIELSTSTFFASFYVKYHVIEDPQISQGCEGYSGFFALNRPRIEKRYLLNTLLPSSTIKVFDFILYHSILFCNIQFLCQVVHKGALYRYLVPVLI